MEEQQSGWEHSLNAPMTLSQLDYDVLSVIVSHLRIRDAFNLALAAREFQDVALRKALAVVSIRSNDHLAQVRAYMLADVHGRLQHMRELTVHLTIFLQGGNYVNRDDPYGARTPAGHLADLLGQAHNLRRVSLSPVDILVQSEPRVGSALTALPLLTTIDLKCLGPNSVDLLGQMQNNPITVQLGCNSTHFLPLIYRMSAMQSLRTMQLELSMGYMGQGTFPASADHRPQWPTVHTLILSSCDASMTECVRAFPGLRVLRLLGFDRHPEVRPTICWPSLDFVEADVQYFLHWHISCPVHHLSLHPVLAKPRIQVQWSYTEDGGKFLPTALNVIKNTSPVVLTLSIMPYPRLADMFWTTLVKFTPRLRCLEVELCEFRDAVDLYSNLLLWMNTTLPIMGNCTELLQIDIRINPTMARYVNDAGRYLGPTTALESSFEVAQEYAQLVVKHIPSIHLLSIGFAARVIINGPNRTSFPPCPWWWRVEFTSDGRVPQPIEPDLAGQIRSDLAIDIRD
ncbi:uncharacterized protein FIBRA_08610 [Fibroporia radiculosa]|uniref:F-box domain-containing protein n=1 Tax=Fibroporia radiculosa TaxID=599839 RepID=J4GHU0_9APHY|nr:uncharacterized protein FIBRA_08610 [Fibroporia radiculosa]CCM06353.1 predicted protein [Fibroporia radiculosa]